MKSVVFLLSGDSDQQDSAGELRGGVREDSTNTKNR